MKQFYPKISFPADFGGIDKRFDKKQDFQKTEVLFASFQASA